MGIYNLSGSEIKDSFKQWLINTSMGEGDISAGAIADAWNTISKNEKWGDYLKAYNSYDKEPNYKEAYYILIEYFDSIADEEKPKVNKKLNKLGL